MFRKDLIDVLHEQPTSLHELAQRLGIQPKILEDDLHHLIRPLRHMPYHAMIIPAACRKCGFTVQKDKLHKPGKCPRCNGTWITPALISIKQR